VALISPLEIYQQYGIGIFGLYFLLKKLSFSLFFYFCFLFPIFFKSATEKYKQESIQPYISGKYLSKFSISNNNNFLSYLDLSGYNLGSSTEHKLAYYDYFIFEWKKTSGSYMISYNIQELGNEEYTEKLKQEDSKHLVYQISFLLASIYLMSLFIYLKHNFRKEIQKISKEVGKVNWKKIKVPQ
jgi:hypothetical protein